jgi:hypothetical protein
MSYNIDDFKVKKLENFKISVKDFDKKVFRKPKLDLETNKIKFESRECEVCEFKGTLVDGFVELNKISIYGEGSGHFMANIGDELLKKSTGTLIARLVWESGDSVEKLTIIDGVEEREEL